MSTVYIEGSPGFEHKKWTSHFISLFQMFVKNKILGRKKTVQKEIFQSLLDVLSIPQNKMISLSAFQLKYL